MPPLRSLFLPWGRIRLFLAAACNKGGLVGETRAPRVVKIAARFGAEAGVGDSGGAGVPIHESVHRRGLMDDRTQ